MTFSQNFNFNKRTKQSLFSLAVRNTVNGFLSKGFLLGKKQEIRFLKSNEHPVFNKNILAGRIRRISARRFLCKAFDFAPKSMGSKSFRNFIWLQCFWAFDHSFFSLKESKCVCNLQNVGQSFSMKAKTFWQIYYGSQTSKQLGDLVKLFWPT